MMDPLTALGLASNIVQLISFTNELISNGYELSKSAEGALVEHLELKTITSSLQQLSNSLIKKESDVVPKSEVELQKLCKCCVQASEELLDAIQDLKVHGPHERWNCFKQALKSVWKESQIKDLSNRLEQYRRQIDTTILVYLKENIQEARSGLTVATETDPRVLGFIEETKQWQEIILENLVRNRWEVGNKQDMAMFSSQLSASAKHQREAFARSQILERLRFTEIDDRYERIPTAYKKTFDWMFLEENIVEVPPHSDSSLNEKTNEIGEETQATVSISSYTQEHHRQWDSFVHWLGSDEPLYWITGKPGSGKSTLMKYLYNDPRTTKLLKSWAKRTPMLTAGFFFWNSGTAMQMSEKGLFQSLLYQALKNRKDLISRLFPDRWRYCELFGNDLRPWSLLELTHAFEILVSDDSTAFFFCIDGLDEFAGDDMKLADLILGVVLCRQNVKMCVASRPWLVFEDAFQHRPSLRLEDLTASDIGIFVLGNFCQNSVFRQLQSLYPSNAERLVADVIGKACGVFLWVRLVVLSLLEGLRDGDNIDDLQERLEQLPSGLEELFRKILSNLNPSYLKQASMLFRLVGAASNPLSLLTLSFADEGFNKIMSTKADVISEEEKMFRADTTRRRLSSRCKGLLEAPDFKSHGAYATVQYLHRTVKDFLRHSSTCEYMNSLTDSTFNPDRELCAAFLLHLKRKKPDGKVQIAEFVLYFTSCIEHSVRLGTAAKNIQIEVLNELERVSNAIFDFNDPERGGYLFDALIAERKREGHLPDEYTHWPVSTTPFMDYALVYPLYFYIEHRLENFNEASLQSNGKFLLRKAAWREDAQIVKLLLQGGVDPNSYIARESMTVWQLILLQVQEVDLGPCQTETGRSAAWAEIIRVLLEYRADPFVTIGMPISAVIIRAFKYDHVQADQLLRKLEESRRGGSKLQFQGFKRLFK